jgi:hypothetical protein
MPQNRMDPRENPRRNAERDAVQPIAGQPRTDEEDDELQDPEQVPSFLTARELQAKDPARRGPDQPDEKPAKPGARTLRPGGDEDDGE